MAFTDVVRSLEVPPIVHRGLIVTGLLSSITYVHVFCLRMVQGNSEFV